MELLINGQVAHCDFITIMASAIECLSMSSLALCVFSFVKCYSNGLFKKLDFENSLYVLYTGPLSSTAY